jgi:murein DD-endopeptidase MepM/ murein hydrolase activator NlpD
MVSGPVKTPSFDRSHFTEFLIRENALDQDGFAHWIFQPGMLFKAPNKWWGDLGRRDKPHEGVDLCLYGNQGQRIRRIGENTGIPVMFDGVIVAMIDDFLGRSVIVEHAPSGSHRFKFYTIYGHTNPRPDFQIGSTLKAGNIFATISGPVHKNSAILPHLHISLGWSPTSIFYDRLNWQTIGAPGMLNLLDPLVLLDWPYQVLTQADLLRPDV